MELEIDCEKSFDLPYPSAKIVAGFVPVITMKKKEVCVKPETSSRPDPNPSQ